MNIIETLDKLLKNELSATETYKQTLDILREDTDLGDAVYLMPIYEDHKVRFPVYKHKSASWEEHLPRTQELGALGRK